jgi:hypothetical protein
MPSNKVPPPNQAAAATTPPLEFILAEFARCIESFPYFVSTYCWCASTVSEDSDGEAQQWRPFKLWPLQVPVAELMQGERQVIALKSRQVGLSWLATAYALWRVLYFPIATVLLFSKTDREAVDLLTKRLRPMHDRLPDWMRRPAPHPVDSANEWQLANGSRVLPMPSTAGDSYTATLVVLDEADLIPKLDRLMGATEPTIDSGGKMFLISRPDKSRPDSHFKKLYRAARAGGTPWVPVFLPWQVRPDRTPEWYEQQQKLLGSDALFERYPATDTEALAPRAQDKRINPEWLLRCLREQAPLTNLPPGTPDIPGLRVYRPPEPNRQYVIGADPAEARPTSCDSAAVVLDKNTGEEVASFNKVLEPAVFAGHLEALSLWYNRAAVLVEKNNHGHAVLLWLRDNAPSVYCLPGTDSTPGWMTTSKAKAIMYDQTADCFHSGEVTIHSFEVYTQLASIEDATLKPPEGSDPADLAVAFGLAVVACGKRRRDEPVSQPQPRWEPPPSPNSPFVPRPGPAGGHRSWQMRQAGSDWARRDRRRGPQFPPDFGR